MSRYTTVGLARLGPRSGGYYSVLVRDGRVVIKRATLLQRWVRPVLERPVDSIVAVSRSTRRPLSWKLSGVSAIILTFADGREITLGVRDPARLEAELSVGR